MSTKRFPPAGRRGMGMLALVLLGALLPAAVPGEVVRLKDGSTLKGRLVRVEGDTLSVRLDLGSQIKIYRALIESIVFSDSLIVDPARPAVSVVVPAAPTGVGVIAVKFEDREVSSKITIDKKKNWDAKVRSNNIVVEFIVDGVVAYTAIDTTTDKTIYLGQDKQLKNVAELKDFTVQVAAGSHRCELVVRNRDPDTYRQDFDPAPLNAVLDLNEVTIKPGGIQRVDVRIDKGMLRTGSPKLYQSNRNESD